MKMLIPILALTMSAALPVAANATEQNPTAAINPEVVRRAYDLPQTVVIRKDMRTGVVSVFQSKTRIPSRIRINEAMTEAWVPFEKAIGSEGAPGDALSYWRPGGWGRWGRGGYGGYGRWGRWGLGLGYHRPYYGYGSYGYPYYNYSNYPFYGSYGSSCNSGYSTCGNPYYNYSYSYYPYYNYYGYNYDYQPYYSYSAYPYNYWYYGWNNWCSGW